ncbi:phage tail assembly protein T [Escherichia coli DEC4B]|nr:phage tail assembly protein T [Escherichia coli DEC4B]
MERADWRAMLAGMTSTEYADWRRFYCTHYFQDTQLDMHFSGLMYAVLSLFFCDPDMHPADFSLFAPEAEEGQAETPDENDVLMQKAAPRRWSPFRGGGKEVVTVIDGIRGHFRR